MNKTDIAWLTEHGAELLREYAGKWVAVADGRIVGVGDTAPEAALKASEAAPDRPFILEHVDPSVDVVYEHS